MGTKGEVVMANIFDYMNWRDLPLKQVEFNEIDNLILARLISKGRRKNNGKRSLSKVSRTRNNR